MLDRYEIVEQLSYMIIMNTSTSESIQDILESFFMDNQITCFNEIVEIDDLVIESVTRATQRLGTGSTPQISEFIGNWSIVIQDLATTQQLKDLVVTDLEIISAISSF